MVTGLLTLMAVVHSVTLDTSGIAYILPLVIYGLGQGTLQAPLVNFILADVPPDEAGSASGVVTMLQQLSFALGVAVIGSGFIGGVGRHTCFAWCRGGPGPSPAVPIGGLTLTLLPALAPAPRPR